MQIDAAVSRAWTRSEPASGILFRRIVGGLLDFCRFWVVHLWVEDFLELFTTIMVQPAGTRLGFGTGTFLRGW